MHFLDLNDFSGEWITSLLDRAVALKAANEPELLRGKVLAMLFEKPSLRTRVSFETAMLQLGGHALNLRPDEVGLGKREPAGDVARVLSGMCDAIMARTFAHATLLELAAASDVPVVNGLTDHNHPCQALADLLTMREVFGDLPGLRLAYIGDGNNVARSLAVACHKVGVGFACCTPPGYELAGVDHDAFTDPKLAVAGADVIYTDTWTSMGQEAEKAQRIKDFAGFIVDNVLLAAAPQHAIVLHCLPAYRDVEISASVIDGDRSKVFQQAHNRLHAQKAVLATLLA
jgi:ornithine carbamoyltransferase